MVWGGESQRASLNRFLGYSIYAQFTGKPAYLPPNRDSLQKPIGGLSLLALSATISMLKNLKRNLNKTAAASSKTRAIAHQLSKTEPINLI